MRTRRLFSLVTAAIMVGGALLERTAMSSAAQSSDGTYVVGFSDDWEDPDADAAAGETKDAMTVTIGAKPGLTLAGQVTSRGPGANWSASRGCEIDPSDPAYAALVDALTNPDVQDALATGGQQIPLWQSMPGGQCPRNTRCLFVRRGKQFFEVPTMFSDALQTQVLAGDSGGVNWLVRTVAAQIDRLRQLPACRSH
jgi:hypothetical protein